MLINMLVSDFRCRYYKAFTTITLFFSNNHKMCNYEF